MLYLIIKYISKIVFRIYYRKIYVEGLENIPDDKPVLLCSNHPNGFLEPLLIGSFIKDSIYFLVRGDLFDKPVLGLFLRNTNQIPIYRRRDGINNLKANKGTMEWVEKALAEHKKILIFPEGGTESVKQLRPLLKGVARMAFDFNEVFPNEDIRIVPISINFTYPFEARSEAFISISSSIDVSKYMDIYNTNKNAAYRALLMDISDTMKKKIIHLEHEEHLELYELLSPLFREKMNRYSFSVLSNSGTELSNEINLSNAIEEANTETKLNWSKSISAICKNRNNANLKSKNYYLKQNSFWKYILLIAGFFPALIGYLTHLLPTHIPRTISNKHAKDDVFWASLLVTTSTAVYLLFYFILGVILFITAKSTGLLILLGIILSGWTHLIYKRFSKEVIDAWRWYKYDNRENVEMEMNELKQHIMSSFKNKT